MTFGAVGLWAVFASSARAAKLYLWTWLPRFLIGVAMALMTGWTVLHTYFGAYSLFWFLYYTKVISVYRYMRTFTFRWILLVSRREETT